MTAFNAFFSKLLRHSRDGLFTRNGFRNYTIFEANLCTTERTGPARGVGSA
jgi:hypothetical protein